MNKLTNQRVNVLLSTYNGERFIIEQLDSLFNQTYTNLAIHIRDDGSTDRTVKLIRTYSARGTPLNLTTGKNIGVVPSFMELLASNRKPGELYAFCDQDDVWKPEKIARAVEQIIAGPEPDRTLYCSRLEYVDENLKHLGFSALPLHIGFHNAVVENIATGCTVVFGETIRSLLLQCPPDDMLMHDWWAYLTASAFGHVIYDGFPSIRYRQHGNTITAWEPCRLERLRRRAQRLSPRLISKQHDGLESLNQAARFLENHRNAPDGSAAIVNTLIDLRKKGKLWERMKYIIHPGARRNDAVENTAFIALVLLGWH